VLWLNNTPESKSKQGVLSKGDDGTTYRPPTPTLERHKAHLAHRHRRTDVQTDRQTDRRQYDANSLLLKIKNRIFISTDFKNPSTGTHSRIFAIKQLQNISPHLKVENFQNRSLLRILCGPVLMYINNFISGHTNVTRFYQGMCVRILKFPYSIIHEIRPNPLFCLELQ